MDVGVDGGGMNKNQRKVIKGQEVQIAELRVCVRSSERMSKATCREAYW